MGRTINGKPIKDVLSELTKVKEPDKYLQGKYPYHKIESYYNRLNEVIGVEHYSVSYCDRIYSQINSAQELISVKCRVTLLDDEFEPICYKEGYGAKEIEYAELTGKQAGLKNMDNNAALNAFKAAWHQFNIFGRTATDEESDSPSGGSNNTHTSPGKTGSNTERPVVSVRLATQSEIYEEKQSQGKPVYKVKTKVIENGVVTEEDVDVIFYYNQYSKNMDTFNLHLKCCKERSVCLDIRGSYSSPRDGVKQFVFKGWAA